MVLGGLHGTVEAGRLTASHSNNVQHDGSKTPRQPDDASGRAPTARRAEAPTPQTPHPDAPTPCQDACCIEMQALLQS